jgi:hypothetical protein
LIWLLSRYLALGETASPLEVQKLLYFLQEAGEPLRLTFEKQRYGPYADAARHAVADLEGHYLTGFGDGTGPGDVRLRRGAIEEAEHRPEEGRLSARGRWVGAATRYVMPHLFRWRQGDAGRGRRGGLRRGVAVDPGGRLTHPRLRRTV